MRLLAEGRQTTTRATTGLLLGGGLVVMIGLGLGGRGCVPLARARGGRRLRRGRRRAAGPPRLAVLGRVTEPIPAAARATPQLGPGPRARGRPAAGARHRCRDRRDRPGRDARLRADHGGREDAPGRQAVPMDECPCARESGPARSSAMSHVTPPAEFLVPCVAQLGHAPRRRRHSWPSPPRRSPPPVPRPSTRTRSSTGSSRRSPPMPTVGDRARQVHLLRRQRGHPRVHRREAGPAGQRHGPHQQPVRRDVLQHELELRRGRRTRSTATATSRTRVHRQARSVLLERRERAAPLEGRGLRPGLHLRQHEHRREGPNGFAFDYSMRKVTGS